MRLSNDLTRLSRTTIITAGLGLIASVGILDYVTGSEISLSIFYLLPIGVVTWYTSLGTGTLMAALSASIWLIADVAKGAGFSHPLVPYWNAIVRFLVFLAVVYLESSLKQLNQDLEKRVEERTALLEAEIAERRKAESRLEQYAQRLAILHEIDQAILAADSLESVAAAIITHAQNLPACERVNFMLIDLEARQVRVSDGMGKRQQPAYVERQIELDAFPGFVERLDRLQQQGVQLSSNFPYISRDPQITQLFGLQGAGSLLSVPIVVQEELLGCLNLISCQPDGFSGEYIEIGREIASQLGIAIKQARMIGRLRQNQESLQALSQRILDVQEAERRTIARELHDEVGQALTGLAFTLELAAQSHEAVIPHKLDQAYNLVSEMMEKISQLSLDLRPALLDDLGLMPTVFWYLDRYEKQTQIHPAIKHSGLEGRRFGSRIETAAFRILQEALTNAARHAHVQEVKVTIWFDQGVLGVQVEDDGTGFDPDAAYSSGNASGLASMRERADLLNGKLTLESSQASGTRVLAELPALDPVYENG
jgi:signal transduction histidine kinase